jgi:hypothetical protein
VPEGVPWWGPASERSVQPCSMAEQLDGEKEDIFKRLAFKNYIPNDPGLRKYVIDAGDPLQEAAEIKKELLRKFDELSKQNSVPICSPFFFFFLVFPKEKHFFFISRCW